MSATPLGNVLTYLRRAVRERDVEACTDGQLLDCFLRERDEAAFAGLVRRHGPMVLGVCRRLLGNGHDAEDAFQATFLVLVRRASVITPRELVGHWLYGVAYRTALKARGLAARRRAVERQVVRLPEPETQPVETWDDWRPLLDRELLALPEVYRAALILCELGGKSKREAARELGVPEGTVSSRLMRGRDLLRRRLTRRGLTLSGAALMSAGAAQAQVPAALLTTTIQAAALVPIISARVATLIEGVLQAMLFNKLKNAALVLLLLCFAGIGTALWAVRAPAAQAPSTGQAGRTEEPAGQQPGTQNPPKKPKGLADLSKMWSQGKGVGKGPVRFTHAPMRLEDIAQITPMGVMASGHVLPCDHQYWIPKDLKAGRLAYDVVAPADGFIVSLQHRTMFVGDPSILPGNAGKLPQERDEYVVIIEHSGTFYTYFNLITAIDPAILAKIGGKVTAGRAMPVRVPVQSGQPIGKVGGHTLDFHVLNTEVTLKGFVFLESYAREPWKPHVVDPFDYFDEPLKSKLLALNARKAEPRGGKIDFDIPGKLIGNWFKENTNKQAGNTDKKGYWFGHLAIAPHCIDPTKISIGLGDYAGKTRFFWVKGNSPDPAKVGAESGVVKYELVMPGLLNSGQPFTGDTDTVLGTLLVQVLANHKLRLEAFPDKTGAEVTGFTKAAVVYER